MKDLRTQILKIGDPLLKHILSRVDADEESVKEEIRLMVKEGILRMKEDPIDHDWTYRIRSIIGLSSLIFVTFYFHS